VAIVVAALAPAVGQAATVGLTSQHLTTLATCSLLSYPSSATVDTDTWIDQSNVAQDHSTESSMQVQSGNASNQRIYLRFDLTQCIFAPPAGAIVRTATLRLWEKTRSSACRTYDIFRVGAVWVDSSISWTNQPPGSSSNSPPTSQRTSSQDIGNVSGCATQSSATYVGFDVTADVVAFLGGTANDGWMIRDDAEDSGTNRRVTFGAHEAGNLAQAPQLLITTRWSDPPWLSSPAGPLTDRRSGARSAPPRPSRSWPSLECGS
jgi:hypothetical protein